MRRRRRARSACPTSRLKARFNAASDWYPTAEATCPTLTVPASSKPAASCSRQRPRYCMGGDVDVGGETCSAKNAIHMPTARARLWAVDGFAGAARGPGETRHRPGRRVRRPASPRRFSRQPFEAGNGTPGFFLHQLGELGQHGLASGSVAFVGLDRGADEKLASPTVGFLQPWARARIPGQGVEQWGPNGRASQPKEAGRRTAPLASDSPPGSPSRRRGSARSRGTGSNWAGSGRPRSPGAEAMMLFGVPAGERHPRRRPATAPVA